MLGLAGAFRTGHVHSGVGTRVGTCQVECQILRSEVLVNEENGGNAIRGADRHAGQRVAALLPLR